RRDARFFLVLGFLLGRAQLRQLVFQRFLSFRGRLGLCFKLYFLACLRCRPFALAVFNPFAFRGQARLFIELLLAARFGGHAQSLGLFEPLLLGVLPRQLVSLGFFPRRGECRNLIFEVLLVLGGR